MVSSSKKKPRNAVGQRKNEGASMKKSKYWSEIDGPSFAYLQIGFENTDAIEIASKYIEIFDTSIFKDLSLTNDKKDEILHCVYLHLCINKGADRSYQIYGRPSPCSVFERLLKFHDIVYINYLDSQKQITKTIYVPWDESSDTDNGYQSTKINEDGNLEILIQRKKA